MPSFVDRYCEQSALGVVTDLGTDVHYLGRRSILEHVQLTPLAGDQQASVGSEIHRGRIGDVRRHEPVLEPVRESRRRGIGVRTSVKHDTIKGIATGVNERANNLVIPPLSSCNLVREALKGVAADTPVPASLF